MNLVKQLLSQNSHWQINKDFARAFGIETAILMTDLIDKWIYHECKEWFFNTSEKIEEDTTLSRHKQVKAFKVLEENGFIEKQVMGVPAKLHFKIFENKILNFFKTSLQETSKLDCEKLQNSYNKNKVYKNKNNKNKGISNVGQNNCPTPPPTKTDSKIIGINSKKEKEKNVSAEKKESHEIEVQEVINYLNDATGRQFDPAAKNSSFVKARLKDGATTKEMKEVIDMKAAEWINNEKMKEYLRPQTLFNKTKYAEYREKYGEVGKKLKAIGRLKAVVDDFAFDNQKVFVWDVYQVEALEAIAVKLKKVMLDKGDELSMDNLEVVLNQVLERLDDYEMDHFSMQLINRNFNTILNAKQRSKKAEWDRLVASFDR